MEFPLLSTGWFTVILDISWWFWHVSSRLQAEAFRALSAALMGLSSSVLLSLTQSPCLQDSFFSVLGICRGPRAHLWEGHIQTSLCLWSSALKMPQSVAALRDEPMHTLSPGVNISDCDWFCLEPFGVNWLGLDRQECRNAQCHFDLTTGNDRG